MHWKTLLNDQRLGRTGRPPFDYSTGRSGFLGDLDRLTFSPSFRRLARKTQVFPLAVNDHVHNRLTHSLEVSRVGRTLGAYIGRHLLSKPAHFRMEGVGWNEYDISAAVEAASLAHDIGHPPFGHAGDRAFRRWFESSQVARRLKEAVSTIEFGDLYNFDGNAQGFRRITQLDKNIFAGGLNLTLTTLAAYVKYPTWSSAAVSKNGFFRSEQKIIDLVAQGVGLIKVANGYSRHPLSFLVEAADDICYGFLDLEDAVEMKILRLSDVADMLLRALPVRSRKQFALRNGENSHRVFFAKIRGKVFHQAIVGAADAFFQVYEQIMAGSYKGELLETAASSGVVAAQVVSEAKQRAQREIFQFENKASIELGSYVVIANLLDAFVDAALICATHIQRSKSGPVTDNKAEMLLSMLGDHRPQKDNAPPGSSWTPYQCVRRAMDFVSGMTDDFAIRLSQQLAGQIQTR